MIEIDREVCKGCLYCVETCPKQMIVIDEKLNAKGYYPVRFDDGDRNECTGCSMCAVICPEAAIEVYRESKK
ncbi:MAG: 4Fe-4S dicluster domain-containing protein [Deltaproteobacteria bacterium]|nr:4Fe-4S dicluster domain-containing protein [Candidatus Zymogenaceae bacterium]